MVHLLTPFSRPQHLPQLLPMLAAQRIVWHPIVHDPQLLKLFRKRWIEPTFCGEVPQEQDPAYWKLNQWITSQPIDDGELYGFFFDDAFYYPGFFDKLRKVGGSEWGVLFVTMHYKADTTFRAEPATVKTNSVGVLQCIVRGRVLRTMRFANSPVADGMMAEWLKQTQNCIYRPELAVKINCLKPGWWPAPPTPAPRHTPVRQYGNAILHSLRLLRSAVRRRVFG